MLKPIPDCILHYTLSSHKAMLRVMNLLPENVIVGGNDIIPGLLDGGDPGNDIETLTQQIDAKLLNFPFLLKKL